MPQVAAWQQSDVGRLEGAGSQYGGAEGAWNCCRLEARLDLN
jgi:hypothetical protein